MFSFVTQNTFSSFIFLVLTEKIVNNVLKKHWRMENCENNEFI